MKIPLMTRDKRIRAYTQVDDVDGEYLNSNFKLCLHSGGYALATVNGKKLYVHRLIAQRMGIITISSTVDHINRDRLDNRRINLRSANMRQQLLNTRLRCDNKSGYKGVAYHKAARKWEAHIKLPDGSKKYLGLFDTAELADEVRRRKEEVYYAGEIVYREPN